MAISEMSSSRPRTMRRNAVMMAGTSSKSSSKPRSFTVPSLRGSVCPRVTSAVFSLVLSGGTMDRYARSADIMSSM